MDTEGNSLTEILNDEPSNGTAQYAADAAVSSAETAQAQATERARDEQGRFAPKGETEGASPAPVEEPAFEHAAVKGERARRQAAEQERDALRADMDALRAEFQSLKQPKAEPEPVPTIWDDDQAALTHWQKQTLQQAVSQNRLITSEMLASQAHDDFDDMQAKFLEMIQANPALADEAMQSRHPWGKAYQIAKNAATAAELGATNLDELRAKIREELIAEQQATPPARPTLPPTLTNERNVGQRSGPAWSGPASLTDLLR